MRSMSRRHMQALAFAGATLLLLFGGHDIAFAHHPMDGATPANWWQGLVSGLAHPVIGLDHLAFICAIGLAGVMIGSRVGLPLSFVAGTVAGCLIHVAALDLPAVEFIVAASLVAIGLGLSMQVRRPTVLWLYGAAVAGLWHGYAYGEAVAGAEAAPIVFYLIGFGAVQLTIGLFVALVADRAASALPQRVAGMTVSAIGCFMLLAAADSNAVIATGF